MIRKSSMAAAHTIPLMFILTGFTCITEAGDTTTPSSCIFKGSFVIILTTQLAIRNPMRIALSSIIQLLKGKKKHTVAVVKIIITMIPILDTSSRRRRSTT
mmetsp:Transcript_23849/g.36221  ORF Transcript_23849/g.36221 Transcript_23849/m.36221 type:complete len:101 (-) Transcript_23849:1970-2272(-)